ncbi:HAD family hydrolase [Microbispora hainanensis]|uniref:HAD family hydrolase n=1 Tax=Microbispora hainanensis TaxID=568844 RepID=UPI002E2AB1D2|nr:HAD family hydrolase [Microbispora hainanensis]
MSGGGYRALTFDGDGTLWNFESAMSLALEDAARLLRASGVGRPDGPVIARWLREVRDSVARLDAYRGQSMEKIRLASFETALTHCGHADPKLARDVHGVYMRARWARLRAYDDVPGSLAALRSRYRLALVTNGNTHPHRVGLDGLFETVVVAAECGLHKPDPEIYRFTVDRLRLDACDVLHVGDDPVEDVIAGRRAGLDTAWINRDGREWPHDEAPPVVVADLRELVLRLTGQ